MTSHYFIQWWSSSQTHICVIRPQQRLRWAINCHQSHRKRPCATGIQPLNTPVVAKQMKPVCSNSISHVLSATKRGTRIVRYREWRWLRYLPRVGGDMSTRTAFGLDSNFILLLISRILVFKETFWHQVIIRIAHGYVLLTSNPWYVVWLRGKLMSKTHTHAWLIPWIQLENCLTKMSIKYHSWLVLALKCWLLADTVYYLQKKRRS